LDIYIQNVSHLSTNNNNKPYFRIRRAEKRDLQGHYATISTVGEAAQAFVPEPLPPNPSLDWMPVLRSKFDQANV
jgi:hypothetical protein